ncbi:integral membrane sensor domain MASE1 [Microbacterium endophyticum]|uniref:Integral membrane sensor domain MASE1 n=1 Tax=Microbacterium endophyticum TaxID=1526412 RepID=A0A7W4YN43_9MICO|nr:SpoIIE family protein phosphatase [Microbacterium endophyticum]MBB2976179.1 integral membrane sensor domain MASE1 [Microbacterium endophyticum]NIK36476.1 integral membrane sensor domain MASE1 [Microbacterium endophyticum]
MSPSGLALATWGRQGWTRPTLVVAGCLLGFFLLGALSLITRPAAAASVAWWPAAGVALGLVTRVSIRYVWMLALAVSALTLPLALWIGSSLPHAIAVSLCVGVELAVGAFVMRGRKDVLPQLAIPRDIGRLVLAVLLSAGVLDILISLADLIFTTPEQAFERFTTVFSRHAAGMLVVAPLFMKMPRRRSRANSAEVVVQFILAVALSVYVFVANSALPLAFLPFVPLVWAAMRMSTRLLLVETLVISVVATFGSSIGRGPFSFERLDSVEGAVVLQVFQLSMVVVFLLLSLLIGREADTRAALAESEELFRRNFDTSVAGMLIVKRNNGIWPVVQSNESARAMLPSLHRGDADVVSIWGPAAQVAIASAAQRLLNGNARLAVEAESGRSFDVSLSTLGARAQDDTFALQFFDVTEAKSARLLQQQELDRAGEVQRALSPGRLPPIPGWGFAALSVPAKEVGGDFYDVRISWPRAVLALGDVMGKGVGAGMLAAATRATLRSVDVSESPQDTMSRSANLLDWDLRRTGAFVTMACAVIDLTTGEARLVDAGHGLSFIVRGDGERVDRIISEDLPLGLDSRWTEARRQLRPADSLLILSDGILDRWGGDIDGFEETVSACAKKSGGNPQTLVDLLGAGGEEVSNIDDVTAVVFRRVSDADSQ